MFRKTLHCQSALLSLTTGAVLVNVPLRAQSQHESALPAPATQPAASKATRNVAIVVHEGVELLDFAGPGEVFAAAGRNPAADQPWFQVYTVAPEAGPIVSQGFVKITPGYTIDNCPRPDIVVIPGGATQVITRHRKFMEWLRQIAPQCDVAMSVCTGAFALADLGLLDGKEVTTHWGSLAGLARAAPNAQVVADRRFVDNGRVVTTAGVSAGIDGALHVVARLLGREIAERTARYMEYRWEPDGRYASTYAAISPELDSRTRAFLGGLSHRQKKNWSEAAKAFRAMVERDPTDGEAWYQLGYVLHAMNDLDAAIPAHQRAAEFARSRHRPLYNLACAWALRGDNERALDILGQAIDAGFDDREFIKADTDLTSLRGDPRFQTLLDRIPSRE